MITPIPDVDLCRHRKTHKISIIHKSAYFNGQLYLGNIAWGGIQCLSPFEAEAQALEIVRKSLNDFSNRASDDTAEFERLGKSGKRTFFGDHQCVGISLRENSDLWLDPVHHKVRGVSGFSNPNERAIVTTNHSPREFYQMLSTCFDAAD